MTKSAIISQWQYQVATPTTISVLPDGCRDVLLRVSATQQLELMLTGLDRTSYQVNAQAGERFYGIRLQAGSRGKWESSPQIEIARLQPAQLLKKLQQVVEQPLLIEQTLQEWLDQIILPPDTLTNEFIDSISQGIMLTGVSERTLRRRVTSSSGAPPSFWNALYRARGVAKALCRGDGGSASELAYHWGYADQAHLCRDMRRWFAQTPGSLRMQADQYLPSLMGEDVFYR